jgi:hypothetical protein
MQERLAASIFNLVIYGSISFIFVAVWNKRAEIYDIHREWIFLGKGTHAV